MRDGGPGRMTETEMTLLRTVSDAGARQAGSAVSQMTGLDLSFAAPRVRALPVDDVAALLGGEESAVVALHLAIEGDARGNFLIALSPDSAGRLLDAMIPGRRPSAPGPGQSWSELDTSGLLEMGNILAAAYLNAVSGCLGRRLVPSVPRLTIDMAGAVIDCLLVEVTRGHDAALVVETALRADGGDSVGHILILHDPAALVGVLRALRSGPPPGSSGGP